MEFLDVLSELFIKIIQIDFHRFWRIYTDTEIKIG